MFSLGNRLSLCSLFVRENALLVDIGSDHGYLPVSLFKSGKVKSAIAADIGEGPLSYARKNAAKYSADVECILSDGFENIKPDSFTDAVIAGMGGELISTIISKADYLKDPKYRLILQPMTAEPELRIWLSENGFAIEEEKACFDSGKIYTVMCVSYVGEENSKISEVQIYLGKLNPQVEESKKYAEKVVKRLSNRVFGAEHREEFDEAEKLKSLINEIKEMYNI
jgi:tRNA (adenine22-N1)-methyltransferase